MIAERRVCRIWLDVRDGVTVMDQGLRHAARIGQRTVNRRILVTARSPLKTLVMGAALFRLLLLEEDDKTIVYFGKKQLWQCPKCELQKLVSSSVKDTCYCSGRFLHYHSRVKMRKVGNGDGDEDHEEGRL
jgi:hypothetical protein